MIVTNILAFLSFSVVAAWLGAYLILGREGGTLMRRFCLAIVFGFSGVSVMDQARSVIGVSPDQSGGDKKSAAKSIQIDAHGYTSMLKSGSAELVGDGGTTQPKIIISDLGCKLTVLFYQAAYYPQLEKDQDVFPALLDGLDAIFTVAKFDGTQQTLDQAISTLDTVSQVDVDSGIRICRVAKGIMAGYSKQLRQLKGDDRKLLTPATVSPSDSGSLKGWIRLARSKDNGVTWEDFLFSGNGQPPTKEDIAQLKKGQKGRHNPIILKANSGVYLRRSVPEVVGGSVKLATPIAVIRDDASVAAVDCAEVVYPVDPSAGSSTAPVKQLWVQVEAGKDSWQPLEPDPPSSVTPVPTPTAPPATAKSSR